MISFVWNLVTLVMLVLYVISKIIPLKEKMPTWAMDWFKPNEIFGFSLGGLATLVLCLLFVILGVGHALVEDDEVVSSYLARIYLNEGDKKATNAILAEAQQEVRGTVLLDILEGLPNKCKEPCCNKESK